MQQNSQTVFNDQLNEVIHQFPQFQKIEGTDGTFYLKGILDIPNDNLDIVGSYMTEIHCSQKFPYAFPILYETGGDITNHPDWHKYSNGSCCITVEPDEMLICKNGITVLQFIQNHAIAFFANHIYRETTGSYKNGEYAHGIDGMNQFYSDLFMTTEYNEWIRYYEHVFIKKSIHCGRNERCFCNSMKKFKHCHEAIFWQLKQIGKVNVSKHLLTIIKR